MRGLSGAWDPAGMLPDHRCIPARDERSRLAEAAKGRGSPAAGHHDHRRWRCLYRRAGHEGGGGGLHRKAGRPRANCRPASGVRSTRARDAGKRTAWRADAASHIAGLTPRQHQIMDLVLAGHPSKNIAADLGISQRTVENHRASIMKKTGSKSLPALARLAVAAGRDADGPPAAESAKRQRQ